MDTGARFTVAVERPIVASEHHPLGQTTLMAVSEPGFAGQPSRRGGDTAAVYAGTIRAEVAHWVECGTRFGAFLDERPDGKGAPAVNGAGVFGSYPALQVGAPRSAISCFLEQNPFKVGKTHLGRPIVHPRQMQPAVTDILGGLNPGRGRDIVAQAGLFEGPRLRFFLP